MIRLTVPSIEEDDLLAVRDALASGFLVQGRRVAAFEQAAADYLGVRQSVAVSSGTAALHLGLLALGVAAGDVVVVAAYSWIATANVIELCGATPVFVDIQPDTFNMDPGKLAQTLHRLSSDPQTSGRVKAVLPVHAFGQSADLAGILKAAQAHNLPVLEDAACALGARWNNHLAGTGGALGCFSFHPRKAITTGEGGMVATNDPGLARIIRSLRNHGQDPDADPADFIRPGFNYRMTEFQAALGLTQLSKLERIISIRRRRALLYDDLLAGSGLQTPFVPEASSPVYQSYVVLLPDSIAARRTELMRRLKESGIETAIGTCHMPLAAFFRKKYGYQSGDFPVTDRIAGRSLTLPLYESITEKDQETVAHAILDFFRQVDG
jgi:dTDP-4-amino-4,6-dideoxygalactose transaminase